MSIGTVPVPYRTVPENITILVYFYVRTVINCLGIPNFVYYYVRYGTVRTFRYSRVTIFY